MKLRKILLIAPVMGSAALLCMPVWAEGYKNQTNQNYQDYNTRMDGNAYDRNGDRNSQERRSYKNHDSYKNKHGMRSDRDSSARYNNSREAYGNTSMNQRYMTLDRSSVMGVQQSLRNEGYNLSVDGVWGPRTTDAIRRFQQANNLDTTGNLDSRTLRALNVNVN